MRETIKYKMGGVYEGFGEVKGVTFKLSKRIKDVCIFYRSDGYYEVVELKQQKESSSVIAGKEITFKEKEIYPYGESWGGVCVASMEKAKKEFKDVLKQSK